MLRLKDSRTGRMRVSGLMKNMTGLLLLVLFVVYPTLILQGEEMEYRKLTPEEERVIIHKGTEQPFTGKYTAHKDAGIYTCRQCGAELYHSGDKFDSRCGWPSFDDEVPGAVKRLPDADGSRTEILCANCDGHLGHVFLGEGMTEKNVRHCVNSVSLDFKSAESNPAPAKAYFAGGCFWGVEHYFQKAKGVHSVLSGYMGGDRENPTYEEVCSKKTGHVEVVEVTFDPVKTSYEELTRLFFEIHDPTQVNRQGPDVGEQYRSVVFYTNDQQKQTAAKLIDILRGNGYDVATEVTQAGKFWRAEEYHQDYYERKGGTPYCHSYQKRF